MCLALAWAQPRDVPGPHAALGDAGPHPLCPQPCSLGRIQSPRSICSFSLLLPSSMPFSRPWRLGCVPSCPPLEKDRSPSRAIIPNASRNSHILGPQPVRFVLFAFLLCCVVRSCSAHRGSLLPWAVYSSSSTQRAVSPHTLHPLSAIANPWEMNQGHGDLDKAPGPGAGPDQDRELGCAGLSWLGGCLVHLRPASWHPVPLAHPLGPLLQVFSCPRPPLCLVAAALPVSQAPACQCVSPLGRDKTVSCLSSVTWHVLSAPRSSSLAAAMREFRFPLTLEARWSKDPLPGGKGPGLPSPLQGYGRGSGE